MKDEIEEWEKIIDNTKNGFEKVTDKELVNHSNSDITTGDRTTMEMTRRLKNEIKRFNNASTKYSKRIILLTIAMLILGFSQIGLLVYQLIIKY